MSENRVPRHLDHLVWAVADLEAGVEAIAERLGVRPGLGGRHPGIGTRNALLSLGPTSYLEVIGPDPEQADPREQGRRRPFGIDDLVALGDLEASRLVTWAVHPPAIERRVEALRALGHQVADPVAMSRRRPDGVLLEWRLTLPGAGEDGVVPFLIDWGETPSPARDAPAGVSLVELRLAHPEPERIARALEALEVEVPVELDAEPSLRAVLDAPLGLVELS